MHIIFDRKRKTEARNFEWLQRHQMNKKFLEALVRNDFCEILETQCKRMILIYEVRIKNNDDLIDDSH